MCGRPVKPEMAPLPACRTDPVQKAFFYTGIDYFGPFEVSVGRGRSRAKNYGVVFTCLTSRAIHLEVAESRFVARRGTVHTVYSDQRTNLVGGCREMRQALQNLDKNRIVSSTACKGISWNFNPPTASNFGGVWEREIRTIRKTLHALYLEHGSRLSGELIPLCAKSNLFLI